MMEKMLLYKKAIESFLQEKTRFLETYEHDMDLALDQINRLERNNLSLMRDIDALSSICRGCSTCACQMDKLRSTSSLDDGGIPVRSRLDVMERVLLERIRSLEAERMLMQLENENQQLQYERCLDQIASHIVEAIVSQKNLREECIRLQRRVLMLEFHNQELDQILRNRYQFSSAPTLQSEDLFESRPTHPLAFNRTFRALGQTKSWVLSQDSEPEKNLTQADLDQACAQDPHWTPARHPDHVVDDHSIDAQIRQVLQLTRDLCFLADVRSCDGSAEVYGLPSKGAHQSDASFDDYFRHGKDLDCVSLLQVQSLLSDGVSTESEETGGSWDANSIGCCCASLSDLLDGPMEEGEEVVDGERLTEDYLDDMVSGTAVWKVLVRGNEDVYGSVSVGNGGSEAERNETVSNGDGNSVGDVKCALHDGKHPSVCTNVETAILGTEKNCPAGMVLQRENCSSFTGSKCCAKTSCDIITTESSISLPRIPLQLDDLTVPSRTLTSASPLKSSTTPTPISKSSAEQTLGRFSTFFACSSPNVKQLNSVHSPICTRKTLEDSTTAAPGRLRGCVHLRNSAPMNDGGSAPSSLSSYQKTSKDINNMLKQTCRSPNRSGVGSSDSLRLLSVLVGYKRGSDLAKHRGSLPDGDLGENSDLAHGNAAEEFEDLDSDPELPGSYLRGMGARCASMTLRRQTVFKERPLRPYSDSCIGYSVLSQDSLSLLDSCDPSSEAIWITPATNSDSFQDGEFGCTKGIDPCPLLTGNGSAAFPFRKSAQSTCGVDAVGDVASDLTEQLQRLDANHAIDNNLTCVAGVADSFRLTIRHTSGEDRVIQTQQNLIDDPQDFTPGLKQLYDNANDLTSDAAPGLSLTNSPTQRLNLETKGPCGNRTERCGFGVTLDAVHSGDLKGKLHSLSTDPQGVPSSQLGSVEPLIPDAAYVAGEDVDRTSDHTRDFDEISAQMRSLTDTVGHLERVLIAYSCDNQTNQASPVIQSGSSVSPLNPHWIHPKADTEAGTLTSDILSQGTSSASEGDAIPIQGSGIADETGSASSVDVTRGECLLALNYTQVNEEQLIYESVDDIHCSDDGIFPDAAARSAAQPLTSNEPDWVGETAVTEDDSQLNASSSSFNHPIRQPWSIHDLSTDENDSSEEEETRSHGDRCLHNIRLRHRHRTIACRRPMMGSKRLMTHIRLKSHSQNALQSDTTSGRHLGDVSSEKNDIYRARQKKSSSDGTLVEARQLSSYRDFLGSGPTMGPGGTYAHGPLQHRSVLWLKQESQLGDGRKSLGPEGGGRECGQLGRRPKPAGGGDGSSCWSLSDSCFETFSGSNPRVNDTTVL